MTGRRANDAPTALARRGEQDFGGRGYSRISGRMGTRTVLSIVITVFNELSTIGRILVEVAKALPEIPKQIIIVDDKSSDGSSD
jgi:glycosyl transferase family 2